MDPLTVSVIGMLLFIGIVAILLGSKSGLLAILVALLFATDVFNQQYAHIKIGEMPIAYFVFGIFALLFVVVVFGTKALVAKRNASLQVASGTQSVTEQSRSEQDNGGVVDAIIEFLTSW